MDIKEDSDAAKCQQQQQQPQQQHQPQPQQQQQSVKWKENKFPDKSGGGGSGGPMTSSSSCCHLYLIYTLTVFCLLLSTYSFTHILRLQQEISENNEWVSTLIGQLAEIRSQLESTDYEPEWHQQHQQEQQDLHRATTDWRPRSERLKRQISGLLDNCGCPAGPPGPPGLKGKKGKKGRNGMPGRPGPPGIPGPPGKNGFPGPIGLDGPKGEQGIQGEKGNKGDVGSPGYDIIDKIQANALGYTVTRDEVLMLKGEPGAPGPIGPAGLQGEPGLPGYDGVQGRPGDPGLKGETGLKGDPGIAGPPGLPGEKGSKGDRGSTSSAGMGMGMGMGMGTGDFPTAIIEGPPGPPGEKGDRGDPGLDGKAGTRGKPGKRGKTGPAGIDGPKGEPGSPGGPGAPGTSGTNGIPGDKGDKGAQGEPGINGKRGKKGPKGDIGPPGPPGLDAPCPIGPDGLPLAGCGWRKSKIDPLPEAGTGFAGSTSTMDHSGGLTGIGIGSTGTKDETPYFGTVTSNSRYGSIEPDNSHFGAPSYYAPPVNVGPSPPASSSSGPASTYGDWDGEYEEDYDDDDTDDKKNDVKKSEEPTYASHSWWESPVNNYQAPGNTWEPVPKKPGSRSGSKPDPGVSKRSSGQKNSAAVVLDEVDFQTTTESPFYKRKRNKN